MAYHVICSSYSRIHVLFSEPQHLSSPHSRLRSKAQAHSRLRPGSNPLNFLLHQITWHLQALSHSQFSYMQFVFHSSVRAVPEVRNDFSVPKTNILYHFSCSVFTWVLPEDPEVDLSLRTHS